MAPEPVGIVNGMARNQQTDVPAIVLHALIGNVRPTVLFLYTLALPGTAMSSSLPQVALER